MKAFRVVLILVLLPLILWSADAGQFGRIVSVQKNVNTKTLYYIVNTPITQDEITYTITVHLKNKTYLGVYAPGKSDPPPPGEWVKDRPVRVQIDGDTMYLKPPAGQDFKVKIAKTKTAAMMTPIRADEMPAVEAPPPPKEEKPSQPLIGLDKPQSKPVAQPAPPAPVQAAAPPAPAPQVLGSISVRTSPYLADLYVDGQNMGYTPAKVNVPPGKHTIRFEKSGYKAWSKDITVTEGSELLVDATLEKK
jgi:hypothetical protein